jgi:hypothetical protein
MRPMMFMPRPTNCRANGAICRDNPEAKTTSTRRIKSMSEKKTYCSATVKARNGVLTRECSPNGRNALSMSVGYMNPRQLPASEALGVRLEDMLEVRLERVAR